VNLPQPPNQQPILTVPDADIAIRSTLLQYLARLVNRINSGFITTFATWTPGSIANSSFASATVVVNQLSPPSPAYVGFSLTLPTGMILHALVTSANTVTVTLFNFTGSTQVIGAGTLQVTGSPIT
jgi:hypothetical protein